MAKLGRPTDNPAVNQFRVRLTDDDLKKLNDLSQAYKLNKSDIIRKGINDMYKGLSKKQ